jgi:hypothetical protein
MKRSLILLALVTATQITNAKSFLLCGRIIDSKGKPVKEAAVQAISADSLLLATSDKNGLYATTPLPAGKYEVVIKASKRTYVSMVNIAPTDPVKRFYNFKLADNNKAILTTTDKDPYIETAYARLKKSERIDYNGEVHIVPLKNNSDSSGNNPK